jgi:uncharacterized protein (TIGR02246 family)
MKVNATHARPRETSHTLQEHDVRSLYRSLLNAWDRRDARGYASFFAEDGQVIGFDGSLMTGPDEIESELERIFSGHRTATYVHVVRFIRFPCPDVAVLFATAGMVPADGDAIDPQVNAMQTMVAVDGETGLRIMSFQNTPAAFHGRPEAVRALTEELRAALRARPV